MTHLFSILDKIKQNERTFYNGTNIFGCKNKSKISFNNSLYGIHLQLHLLLVMGVKDISFAVLLDILRQLMLKQLMAVQGLLQRLFK